VPIRDQSEVLMREGDDLVLELGGSTSLQCRIVKVDGPEVVVLVDGGVPTATAAAAATGAPVFATFERDGQLHARKGVVRRHAGADRLALRVTDTFAVGHRRAHTRAPLALAVRRQPVDASGAPVGTALRERTLDLSASGARLACDAAPAPGARQLVTLKLPGGPVVGPLRSTVVRVGEDGVAVRFDRVGTADRARIALLVLGWHHQRLEALERP
jgi:c-di-GMP-binding flagellar brake protein YcgR